MASSYQQTPDYASSQEASPEAPDCASSQEATPDLATASMNPGEPSNTMMTSSTLPAQAGGPGDAQTNTPSMQRSQHDSRGSESYDPSAQPRSYQEPSYESWSDDEDLEDVYIAVMGITGAGKSTFIEKLTGKKINIGHGLFSCTADVEDYTFVYKDKYKVHLVDTPGFDDTQRKDIDVLKEISGVSMDLIKILDHFGLDGRCAPVSSLLALIWLGEAYANHIKLSGIIYLHRITDVRMTGTARKNLFMFKKLCGRDCFQKVCLVTTMWENVDEGTGNMREKELIKTEDFWGYMARNGSQVRRHMNTRASAMSILKTLIKHKRDIVLDIQKELGDGKQLDDTGAGRQLNEEIHKIQEKHRQELADLEEEKQDALRRRDAESVEQIEELQRENAQKLKQIAQDREIIKVDMAKILEEHEQQLREYEERIARYDQSLREKEEEHNRLKEKQMNGEENSEQTQALEQEIDVMRKMSQAQHKKANKKKRWIKNTWEWVNKHRKGLSKLFMAGSKIGVDVMNFQ